MELREWIQIAITIVGTTGGLELIKFITTRASVKQKEEAAAELATAKAEDAQLDSLRRHAEWLQEQLTKKEERFAEQTDLVRNLQANVLRLTGENEKLKVERSLKLCERRNCAERMPQSGY